MTGVWKKLLFLLILLTIWQTVYEVTVNYLKIWQSLYFPSPFSVGKALGQLLANNTLETAMIASMRRLILGYLVSVALGGVIGLGIARFKYLTENLTPVILGLQTLPNVSWLPFALLWYGSGENAILFMIIIGSTFAITLATLSGVQNVDPIYVRAGKTLGAKGLKIYTRIIVPASLPVLVAGLKQGWAFAWRGLIAGEMLSTTKGLGQVLAAVRNKGGMSQGVAVMLVIIFLGLTIDKLIFGNIEQRIRYLWGLDKA